MGTVGRSWYVKVTEGMVGTRIECGTHHVAPGTQVWQSRDCDIRMDGLTEHQIVQELWYAVSLLLEQHTSAP